MTENVSLIENILDMIEKYCWVRGEGRLLYILAVGGGRWPVAPLPQTLEYEEPGEKRGALGKCFFLSIFVGEYFFTFLGEFLMK